MPNENRISFTPDRIQKRTGTLLSAPLVNVGFPLSAGSNRRDHQGAPDVSPDATEWFPKLLRQHGPAACSLWLMHEPPNLTRLSMRSGPLQGNPEWREAIERYSPMLVVSGHDHQTPFRMGFWHDRIGATLCLNAGQGNETLHYFVIDASFRKQATSLPTSLVITHWPTKASETIQYA